MVTTVCVCSSGDATDMDEDVSAEEKRILSGSTGDCPVILQQLRKVFPSQSGSGLKVAVNSLSFSRAR